VKGAAPLALLLAAAPGREAIGVWGGWGAFRDAAPARCFAIARPVDAAGRAGGFASVADWPARRLRDTLHLRLSRPRDPSAAVTLSVGERRFALVGRGVDAWAADAASDRAVVAAMRGARSMSVETEAGGRPLADVYALAGAATAIDAAALACLRR
jgi:hypothetical protein